MAKIGYSIVPETLFAKEDALTVWGALSGILYLILFRLLIYDIFFKIGMVMGGYLYAYN